MQVDAGRLEGNVLAVERFDGGPDGQRIHMEDFAQVFGIFPEQTYKRVSYANIARVLWNETGEQGAFEFTKRLIFAVLTGNADMHLKNWSLLDPDMRTAILSPAYDFVSTVHNLPTDKLALSFGGSRSPREVNFDQIRSYSDKSGLPLTPIVHLARETAEQTIAAWQTLDCRDLLPGDLFAAISSQIEGTATRSLQALP